MKKQKMKRVGHKSKSFEEALEWDIKQQIKMSPDQRFAAAKKLRIMVYGNDVPDVKDYYEKNKKR